MEESKRESAWVDPDDAPELPDDWAEHSEYRIGGKLIRPATKTFTGKPLEPVTVSLSPSTLA